MLVGFWILNVLYMFEVVIASCIGARKVEWVPLCRELSQFLKLYLILN